MKKKNLEANYPRITALTIFRVPLAIWVLLHHLIDRNFASNQTPNNLLTKISDTGNMAVTSFFILSGFVISYSYENSNKPALSDFYFRRIFSLYPYCIGTTIAVYFSQPIEREYLLQNIIGIQSFYKNADWFVLNGPSWSVSVEILMYLLFPAMIKFFTKILHPIRTLTGILTLELFLSLVIGTNFDNQTVFYLLYHFPPFQFFHFITGILCFQIYKSFQHKFEVSQLTTSLVSATLFVTSMILSQQTNLLYLQCGIFAVIPTIVFILGSSSFSKSKETKISRLSSLLYKAGQGTFVFYITHWLWVGSLRTLLSSESNQFFMLLKLILVLIPILAISYKLSVYSTNIIANRSYYKLGNKRGLSKVSFAVMLLMLSSFLLGMLNTQYPRHWSTENLPRNHVITTDILKFTDKSEDNIFEVKVKLTNNSIQEQTIKYCNLVFTPKELLRYSDLPKPVFIESKHQMKGWQSIEVVYGVPRVPGSTDSFYLSMACK